MPQFRVLESDAGVTIDALVTIDANAPAFSGTALALIGDIESPSSAAGKAARDCLRSALAKNIENVRDAVDELAYEQATSEMLSLNQKLESSTRWATDKLNANHAAAIAEQQAKINELNVSLVNQQMQLTAYEQADAERSARNVKRAAFRQKKAPKAASAARSSTRNSKRK